MKIKWIVSLALGLPLAAIASLEQKSPPTPPANANNPLLVWDIAPGMRTGLPRNFRTTNDRLKTKDAAAPNTAGLTQLRASGSAEFTVDSLKAMLAKLPGPVAIFDLRQEDHGFVNGNAVSWYATNNWANVGKSPKEVAADEKQKLRSCAVGGELVLSSDAAVKVKSAAPDTAAAPAVERVTVQTVQTEKKLVTAAGASYVRIPVTDHCRPTDAAVDQFILAVRALPAGTWAHFHCRAGKGRTTTFMVLYDMLRNAREVSLPDIARRQSDLIGDYNVLAVDPDAGGDKAGVRRWSWQASPP